MGKNRDHSKFPNAITVLDNGNVGIGTNSPTYTFDITGTGRFTSQLSIGATLSSWGANWRPLQLGSYGSFITGRTDDNSMFIGKNVYFDGTNWIGTTTGYAQQMFFDSSGNTIFRNVSATASTATGFNETMRILANGNVGIGTSSPSSFANGGLTLGTSSAGKSLILNSSVDGDNGLIQFIDKNSNNSFQIFGHSLAMGFYGYGARDMQFYTNGSERMRITSGGNIGMGTSSPGSKLHLYDGANPLSLKIQRTSVPVYLSDVQPAGTTAAAAWTHNMENTSNGSASWGGFANGSYAGSAIMLNANTGSSYITFLTAPSANTNPTERFRIDGTNGYTNTYKSIGNIASTSLASLSDAQTQRWYFTSQCNNTWRALVANINFRSFVVRMWGSDAGTSNYGEHYFTMSFPGYGVSNNANLHYVSGGWNTGAYELSYTNNGGAYYLIFRNTSYYDSNNVATYYMEIISV